MTEAAGIPNGAIAIVGMAGRFPGAPTLERYWQNLVGGVESLTRMTEDELLAAGVPPGLIRNPDYVPVAAIIDGYDLFDAAVFGMTPREAALTDPQHRLFLELSREALEASGHLANREGLSIGVFGGAGGVMSSYLVGGGRFNADLVGPTASAAHIANDKDFLCSRVAFKLDLAGPAVTVQTACSTSLVAVHMACQSLLAGECDMALAGGVTLRVPHHAGYLYREGDILSPDGHCRAFDAAAAGTIFGSGAGIVTLRPLRDALADGDMIHAVIRGTAVGNDGGRKTSYWATRADGQTGAMRQALAMAEIDPASVTLIEAHGTGTALGDAVECLALSQVYGAGRDRDAPCSLGSVKSNIGHLEAAAGIASLIKAVLALENETIPPTLHVETPNPKIDFGTVAPVVAARAWCGPGRRAAVNSLGVGGTNAHLVLEAAPARPAAPPAAAAVRPDVLCLSAASAAALRQTMADFAADLRQRPADEFAALCQTVNNGRPMMDHRAAVVAATAAEAADALDAWAGRAPAVAQAAAPKLGFLFSGQGTQYPGMAAGLYRDAPAFRAAFDRCADLVSPLLDAPLQDLVFATGGDAQRLNRTEYTQPALFAVEWALAELWRVHGVRPVALLGHSVGEYVAACIAGVFPLETALRIVVRRGKLMANVPDDAAMLALLCDAGTAAELAEAAPQQVSLAAVNGPASTTVAGSRSAIDALAGIVAARGIAAVPLAVSRAFHSHLIEPVLAPFERFLRGETLRPAQLPVISNLDGKVGDSARFADPAYWVAQMRQPVQFARGIATLLQRGINGVIEIGPKPQLTGLARACVGDTPVTMVSSLDGRTEDGECFAAGLAKLYEAGQQVDLRQTADSARPRVPAPPTAQEKKRFWIDPPAGVPDNPGAGHPVLGHEMELPGGEERRFAWTLGHEMRALLEQHRLWEHTVIPAAYHVAVLIEAARLVLGDGRFCLADIVFPASAVLVPGQETRMQLIVRPGPGRERRLSIAVAAGPELSWRSCCDARLLRDDARNPDVADPELDDETNSTELYAALDALGYRLGPAFRRLATLDTGDGATAARLSPDETDRGFAWHPGLLDSVYQLLLHSQIPAMRAEPGAILVPFSIERLDVAGDAGAGGLICRVTGKDVSRAGLNADLVVTEAGAGRAGVRVRTLLTIRGLSARLARRDNLGQSDRQDQPVLHQLEWQVSDDLSESPGPAPACVLLGGGDWQRAAIAVALKSRGTTVTEIEVATPEELGSAVMAAPGSGPLPRAVIFLADPQPAPEAPMDRAAIAADVGGFVAAIKALADQESATAPRLICLTFGARDVKKGDAAKSGGLWQAPLHGYVQVARQEHPELRPMSLDLDDDRPETVAACLLRELARDDDDGRVAYRRMRRHVARLVPLETTKPAESARFNPDKTVLITGAFGAIGRRLARWLAAAGVRRFALVGRADPSPGTVSAALVAELKMMGAEVGVFACDLAQAESAGKMLRRVAEDMPPLGSVFHLAGTLDDAALEKQTATRFEAAFAAKAGGAWALHLATRDLALDYFVMFSSVASLFGTAGQANYAGANAFLDALAAHRRASGLPATSLNWGTWAGTGMAAGLSAAHLGRMEERGLPAMSPDRALQWFGRALKLDGPPQIAVQPVDWSRYHAAQDAHGRRPSIAADTSAAADKSPTDPLAVVTAAAAHVLGRPTGEIRPEDNLIDMGLDSLGVIELRARLRDATGVSIPSRAVFEMPHPSALARLIRPREPECEAQPAAGPDIGGFLTDMPMPALRSQAGLWALQQREPEAHAYNMALIVELAGALDSSALRRAAAAVFARNDGLRLRFRATADGVMASLAEAAGVEFGQFDLSAVPLTAQDAAIRAFHERAFDLSAGPLLRVGLFDVGPARHVLLLTLHHIVGDFTTLELVMRDLETAYRADTGMSPAAWQANSAVTAAHAALVGREAAYLEGPNCDEDRAFWREVLDALPPPLPWPRDSRPAQAPLQTVGFSLPEAESELLRQYCRKHTVTPLAVVLAVWSEVVARSCGQRDIVLGTPVSLRDDASREIAGHQINMLPLRLQADIGTSFEARVIDARDRLLDGLDHRRLPLAEILADHGAPAVSDRHPLFQSAVALQAPKLWPAWSGLYLAQSGEDSVKDEWAGLNLRPRGLDQQMGQIDAMLEGIDTGRVLRFVLKADCAQVSHALAQSMAAVFRRLIAAALRHPERALGGLEASAEAKAGLILPPYGQVLAPHQPSYPEVFAAVAAIAPEKAAVICGAQRLSYRELDRRSAALAERIADHAAGSGRRVAVCLRPSVDAVVAMLAVMRAGAAYVPVHPDTPPRRIAQIFSAGQIVLAIADRDDGPRLPESAACLAPWAEDIVPDPKRAPPHPDAVAYTVFTSGSTGVPKGVDVGHAALVAMLDAVRRRLKIEADDRSVWYHEASFDFSVWEIWSALAVGCTLIVVPETVRNQPDTLYDLIGTHFVTILSQTPSALAMLLPEIDRRGGRVPESLRMLVLCGEALPAELARRAVGRGVRLWNMYGVAEATVFSTAFDVTEAPTGSGPVPLGQPLASAAVRIVDAEGRPLPDFVAGEIELHGPSIAQGYVGLPELTAARFGTAADCAALSRWYRTGDVGHWDGQCLHYHGRRDGMVKLRGHRVELAEVENALLQIDGVAQCAAAVAGDALWAFVVAETGQTVRADVLRDELMTLLPQYMVPGRFHLVEALKRSRHGKLDRAAMVADADGAVAEPEPPMPRPGAGAGGQTARLQALWRQVLRREDIPADANFFDLGGTSVSLMQVHTALTRDAGLKGLKPSDLFRHTTLRSLGGFLERHIAAPRGGAVAPTPARSIATAEASAQGNTRAIAVIGMALRVQGAGDVGGFWSALMDGRTGLPRLGPHELRQRGVTEALIADPAYVPVDTALPERSLFDPTFFGISQREAERMDPQHRLMIEAGWELLERIGYNGRRKPQIGVFVASTMNTYLLNVLHDAECDLASQYGTETMLGNDKDFLPARMSYLLGLTGPSMAVQTGCSSSLVAVHQAMQSLRAGECDIALAGGVSVHVTAQPGYRHAANLMFSPDGRCRAFDAAAAGTPFADGLGLVALRRLDDALAAGDRIEAVLRGSASNNDGAARAGFAAPGVAGQAALLRAALLDAGLAPGDIGYLEAHGTGTALGDAVEVAALREVFGQAADAGALRAIGTVKANLGHLAAAAGAVALIKTILAVRHGMVPPHPCFDKANPDLGLAEAGLMVNAAAAPWLVPGRRRAGVSSFGLGGSNAHVVVEEPPRQRAARSEAGSETGQGWQIAPLSARSRGALDQLTRATAEALTLASATAAANIAATLQLGRPVYGWRCAGLGRDAAALAGALTRAESVGPMPRRLRLLIDDEADLGWLADPDLAAAQMMGPYLREGPQRLTETEVFDALGQPGGSPRARLVAMVAALELWRRICADAVDIQAFGSLAPLARDVVLARTTLSEALRRARAPERPGTAAVAPDEANRPDTLTVSLSARRDAAADLGLSAPLQGSPERPGWLLRGVAECWTHGIDIDWEALPVAERGRRVDLPSHPLMRRHCWWTGEKEPASAATGQKADVAAAPRLFRETWNRFGRLPAVRIEAEEGGSEPRLVLSDRGGRMQRWLGRTAQDDIIVTPGGVTRRTGPRRYDIDTAAPGAGDQLAALLAADGAVPVAVLCGWPLDAAAGGDDAEAMSDLFALAEALRGLPSATALPVEIVTSGACEVTGGETVVPGQTAYLGLAKVLGQEMTWLQPRVIDIDRCSDGGLAATLAAVPPEQVQALRGGYLWHRGFAPVEGRGAAPEITAGAACLVTGGLGPVGMTLGRALWQTHGTPLVLTTAGPVPPQSDWPGLAAVGEPRFARLLEWQRDGVEFAVMRSDVTDAEDLKAVLAAAERKFGSVRAFLHCAGVPAALTERWIAASERADWRRIVAPKLDGARSLDLVFRDRPLDLGCFVSSLSAVAGGQGLAAYAAAHAAMEALALAHAGTRPYLAVAWDGWTSWGGDVSGTGTSETEAGRLRRARAIAPDDAARLQDAALKHAGEKRLFASRVDMESLSAGPAPWPDRTAAASPAETAAVEPVEDRLEAIWCGVLGSPPEPSMTFFEQGGDSLRAVELIRQVNTAFAAGLTPPDFFAAPTIEGLAGMLGAAPAEDPPAEDRFAERRRARRRQHRARTGREDPAK